MKRFTMIVALLLMVAMPMMAERVSPETAQKVAQTFLNNNGEKAAQLTDLSKIAGFPNLYIFTAEQGFVVMAADDCVQPILGYSLTGGFITEDMPSNMRGWLQGYNDEIQSAIDNQMKATAETSKKWKDLIEGDTKAAKATVVVSPLIQTKWSQNKYYNALCPEATGGPDGHAYTGCVATAMAQIMKYWEYPSHGIGSHSYTWNGQTLSADFGNTTYDWGNMANYYQLYYANGTDQYGIPVSNTQEQITAVATLMYHCGVAVDMNYSGSGSAASSSNAANALKTYFNYSSSIEHKQKSSYDDAVWIQMVKDELNAQRPLEYSGRSGTGSNTTGHSFVCDGYDNANYFHFNWGWWGHYNGYFSLSNLDTGANGEPGSGNGVYTYVQAAIFGIQPVECAASDPTNLTCTLNGLQSIILNWTAANGAASYNIYRNNSYVGNSTTNTYTETAPFGNNVYYVRSVDANGNLSLSSNTITVYIGYQTPIVDDLTASLSGNNVSLSWTAPEWCYPETPTATLNYGSGNVRYSWTSVYYGHRHLASNLAQYSGKGVYKVSTYIKYPGTYSLYIYSKSTSYDRPDPNSLSANINSIPVTISNGWYEFVLSEPVILTGTDDLWVVLKQENTNQQYPTPSFDLTEHNTNAFYAGSSPTSLYDANSSYNCAWLINTYLTDGTYTYNLYEGTSQVAQGINDTCYTVSNIADNAVHQYTVKTNYYGGESAASNMVGFAVGTSSIASLDMAANDQMTITEGSQLTVSGTMSNDDANNLIIENGAQLIHNSNNVKATVKKTIEAYTADDNGWNFIASPVTESFEPSTDNGLLANNYDLYLFDQSQDKEWRNIKAGAFGTINHKTGYLYANNTNTTLTFAGTLAATAEPADLDYDGNATLKGFNLVGNPYPCNATVINDFYIINGNAVELAENGATIAPCEGIFVKATDTDQTVTFSKANSAKGMNSKDCFDLVVTQGKANIDRARVRFGEGIGMEKYALDSDKGSKIALWQEGQDFAVAYTNGQDEMPINFKAAQDGMYSISIEANSLDLDYLHLIDNLTGNDVDLLVTPNYTFEAKTIDYASRFRLLFAPAEEIEVATDGFAFFADGHLHVFNQGDARLQLIDMTGHILLAETLQGNLDKALNLVPGVYVVRLISEKDTRCMKIVVD